MKIKFMVAATLMAALVTTTSCGNSNKQSQSEKTEQAAPAALSIDNLLVHADSLANKGGDHRRNLHTYLQARSYKKYS